MSHLERLVDRLGALTEERKALDEKIGEIKADLVSSNRKEVIGDSFRATVIRTEVERVNWHAIAVGLSPSAQRIRAHTTLVPRTTVQVREV